MEKSNKEEKDISGAPFSDFKARFPRVRFKILHKIDTDFSNRKLYEKGYLKNYVEDYLQNPLAKKVETLPIPTFN